MKGIVKWYKYGKGYGLIEGEDGIDVFVHRIAIPIEILLYEGDKVEYEIEKSERGSKATNVKRLKNI